MEQFDDEGGLLVCLGKNGDPGLLKNLRSGPARRFDGDISVGDSALG
jgi:hypothetical protein